MTIRYEYRTPGTRLWWSNVGEWVVAARKIDRRRLSRQRDAALKTHGRCMPREMIDIEMDIEVIDEALDLLKHGPTGLARPLRGGRAKAPQTRIIMDLMNRRAALIRDADDMANGDNWTAVFGSDR